MHLGVEPRFRDDKETIRRDLLDTHTNPCAVTVGNIDTTQPQVYHRRRSEGALEENGGNETSIHLVCRRTGELPVPGQFIVAGPASQNRKRDSLSVHTATITVIRIAIVSGWYPAPSFDPRLRDKCAPLIGRTCRRLA